MVKVLEDPAVALITRYRRADAYPEPRSTHVDYVGILVDEMLLRGHQVNACSAAYKWWHYRQALLSILKRWRSLGLSPEYKRELEREARMTMAVLAGFYHRCRRWYEKRMKEEPWKRWRRDLYAAMVDAAQRLHAYLEPCYDFDNTMECLRARIQMLLEGARRPDIVLAIINRYGNR